MKIKFSFIVKVIVLFFFHFAYHNLALGQNLVPNPSFEEYNNCPSSEANMNDVLYWVDPMSITTSDYYNACATLPAYGIPVNNAGTEDAHTGNGYVGICAYEMSSGWMEYIQVQLTSPMIAGQTYTVSYWASCSEDDNGVFSTMETMGISTKLSVLLTQTAVVDDPNLPFGPLPGTPQMTSNQTINTSDGWELLTWTYVATGGENFLTIGCWNTTETSYCNDAPSSCSFAYYFIDDVSVEPSITMPLPVCELSSTSTCFNTCEGTATATVSSGTPPYTYTWSGTPQGQGTATITGLCPGIYTVNITDANGNTTSNSVVIEENPEIIIQVNSSPLTNCNPENGSASAVASGGTGTLNYLWNPTNSSSPNITNLGTGTYNVTVTDQNNCTATSSTVVTSNVPVPTGQLNANITEGCEVLCVNFSFQGSEVISYNWQFENGISSEMASPHVCFEDEGIYNVSLSVTDQSGCSTTFTHNDWIVVHPTPTAEFNWNISLLEEHYFSVQLHNLSTDATFYSWKNNFVEFSNEQNPTTTYTTSDFKEVECINLIALSEYGCIDSIEHCFDLIQEAYFYIPNSFTPDRDQFNNEFHPFFSTNEINNYELMIFNRWGELIFSTTDVEYGWDGTYKNLNAPNGTYNWLLKFEFEPNKIQEVRGHVNLLR